LLNTVIDVLQLDNTFPDHRSWGNTHGQGPYREAVCSLYDFDAQTFPAPRPDEYLDEDDPFVKANRWAFVSDDELAVGSAGLVTEVVVEAATSAPGEEAHDATLGEVKRPRGTGPVRPTGPATAIALRPSG